MKRVHCLDTRGYKACEHKTIPKKYRTGRNFENIEGITCRFCMRAIGKPYFSDNFLFEDAIARKEGNPNGLLDPLNPRIYHDIAW